MTYNHCDSYPTGLGLDLLRELRHALAADGLATWLKLIEDLVILGEDVVEKSQAISVKAKDVDRINAGWREYAKTTEAKVVPGFAMDLTRDALAGEGQCWYWALRWTQGSYSRVFHSGFMIAGENDTVDDCDYNYLLDLDARKWSMFTARSEMTLTYALDELPSDETFIKEVADLERNLYDEVALRNQWVLDAIEKARNEEKKLGESKDSE